MRLTSSARSGLFRAPLPATHRAVSSASSSALGKSSTVSPE